MAPAIKLLDNLFEKMNNDINNNNCKNASLDKHIRILIISEGVLHDQEKANNLANQVYAKWY